MLARVDENNNLISIGVYDYDLPIENLIVNYNETRPYRQYDSSKFLKNVVVCFKNALYIDQEIE